MAYDPGTLLAAAQRHLQRTPMARLAAVAKACGVSTPTLARAVRTESGLTYRRWQQQLARDAAERLLRDSPPCSIKEVSATLGFAHPRSFARWLKRQTGRTPSTFRGGRAPTREAGDVVRPSPAQHAGGAAGPRQSHRCA